MTTAATTSTATATALATPENRAGTLRTNAIAMFLGQFATWGITALTLMLLPRYLGPERMGQMSIGMSFAVLTMTVAGLGMDTLIIRDVARERAATARRLGTAVWLHLGLGIVGATAAFAIAAAAGYGLETQIAIALCVATVPFLLLSAVGIGVLQGVEVMRHQAIWNTFTKGALLGSLLVVMAGDFGLFSLLALILLWEAVSAGGLLISAHRQVPFPLWTFSLPDARYLVVASLPFFTVGIFVVLYVAVDVLQLSLLAGETAVGIYSAPSRIFGTMLFMPTIIITVAFPQMAADFRNDPARLVQMCRGTLRLVLAFVVPLTVLVVGLSGDILVTIIGEGFAGSGPVIAMLGLSLIPTSVLIITHRIMVATDRQNTWTVVMFAALVVKVGLNFLMVPVFDRWLDNPALGAATSLVAVETALMLSTFWLLPRGVIDRRAALFYMRLGLAAVAGAVTIVALGDLGWFVAGCAGAALYGAVALLTRAHSVGELLCGVRLALGKTVPGIELAARPGDGG